MNQTHRTTSMTHYDMLPFVGGHHFQNHSRQLTPKPLTPAAPAWSLIIFSSIVSVVMNLTALRAPGCARGHQTQVKLKRVGPNINNIRQTRTRLKYGGLHGFCLSDAVCSLDGLHWTKQQNGTLTQAKTEAAVARVGY